MSSRWWRQRENRQRGHQPQPVLRKLWNLRPYGHTERSVGRPRPHYTSLASRATGLRRLSARFRSGRSPTPGLVSPNIPSIRMAIGRPDCWMPNCVGFGRGRRHSNISKMRPAGWVHFLRGVRRMLRRPTHTVAGSSRNVGHRRSHSHRILDEDGSCLSRHRRFSTASVAYAGGYSGTVGCLTWDSRGGGVDELDQPTGNSGVAVRRASSKQQPCDRRLAGLPLQFVRHRTKLLDRVPSRDVQQKQSLDCTRSRGGTNHR